MDLLDGSVGSLLCLKVHESIALGLTHLVLGHLARKNVPKGTEGVEEGLVVDGLVKVFDEDVAHPGATKRRVTLGPHDPAWAVLNDVEVHGVKGTLSCREKEEERTGAIPKAAHSSVSNSLSCSYVAKLVNVLLLHGSQVQAMCNCTHRLSIHIPPSCLWPQQLSERKCSLKTA